MVFLPINERLAIRQRYGASVAVRLSGMTAPKVEETTDAEFVMILNKGFKSAFRARPTRDMFYSSPRAIGSSGQKRG
jgi:hypothetical protein